MIQVRHDDQIHRQEGGWFHARWHFSFDQYRDPEQMGFGPLRVFNDDRLEPGAVWPLHPHRDIEGITYVVEGSFEHADSLGNGGQLPPGSIQRATLGSGMLHSERNGSATEPMRFLQFWILPDTPDLEPSVQQRSFSEAERANRLLRVAGPLQEDPVLVHQDASVHLGLLDAGVEVAHPLGEGRGAYVYLIRGRGQFDDEPVETGAAARVFDQATFLVRAAEPSELILVDLPLRWTPVGVWAAMGAR
ncbi:MAG: pirin family protein [Chloroflexi bacterium]|nr:MAG: pirin family protein [Chloroflexota bacterium]